MSVEFWTHPVHRRIATVGTLFNVMSLLFCIESIIVTKWFSNYHQQQFEDHYLLSMDVDCSDDVCIPIKEGQISVWQRISVNLSCAALINNFVTFGMLAFAFWPLAAFKNIVLNYLLATVRTLNFVGAFFKYIGAFIYFSHAHGISKSYGEHVRVCLKLEMTPIALLLFSFLFEMISVALLIVATDEKPRIGGKTHRQRLGFDEVGPFPDYIEEVKSRKISYAPDSKESHMRVLSQIKFVRRPSPEYGTPV